LLDVVIRLHTMTLRYWIRIVGLVLGGFGLLCLPSIGRSPQSYGSGFAILSDTGSPVWIGVVLIVAGAIVFLGSFAGGDSAR
jgi:hypothetical protein